MATAQSESLFLPHQLSRTANPQHERYRLSEHVSVVAREGAPQGSESTS